MLRAGQVRDWMRLVSLGLEAASAAGASADLAYFAQEDSVRRVLLGQASADPASIAAATARRRRRGRPWPRPRAGWRGGRGGGGRPGTA